MGKFVCKLYLFLERCFDNHSPVVLEVNQIITAHIYYFTGCLLTCLVVVSTSEKSKCIQYQSLNVHMIQSLRVCSVNTMSSVFISSSLKHIQPAVTQWMSLYFVRASLPHTHTPTSFYHLLEGVSLFSFTHFSSVPSLRVTTSLFSACLHSPPLLKSLSLVLSQHICCFSPGSSWTSISVCFLGLDSKPL